MPNLGKQYMPFFSTNVISIIFGAQLAVASLAAPAMEMNIQLIDFGLDRPLSGLLLKGPIRKGDAQRLRQLLGTNIVEFASQPFVILDSPGGDVDEALQLAQILREAMANTILVPPSRCASACFFLYVASPSRMSLPNVIAIHRPFFAAETTRKLSAPDADAAQNAAYARVRRWLQDQLVPQELIDKMFSLPSTQAYFLTKKDIDALGQRSAWYEEWLLARCPKYLDVERRVQGGDVGARAEYLVEAKCEADSTGGERVNALVKYRIPKKRSGQ